MNTKVPRCFVLVANLLASLWLVASSSAAVRSTEEGSTPSLPPIWEQAGPRERLKAVRAAELDGNRLLVERIYGIQVDGDTTVYDLALKEDEVNGAVQASIAGVVTVGEPEFFDDGP